MTPAEQCYHRISHAKYPLPPACPLPRCRPKAGPLKVHNEGERLEGRIGTWLYMAPEVYRQEVYCEKADVFR